MFRQAYKHFWEKDCIGFSIFKFFPKKSQEKFSGETACSKFWGARRLALGALGKLLFGSYALEKTREITCFDSVTQFYTPV